MAEKVLLVDDDKKLRTLLKEYLEGYGYSVLTLPDGSAVGETIKGESPDIVILDIMMPGKNGLDVLRDIRMTFAIPVIMLTAKGEAPDRIVGLELGADDYLPKPFDPRELLARIKAVLRRGLSSEKETSKEAEPLVINAGGLALNRAKQNLSLEGQEVDLSSTEYKILEALMMHPNTVLSRDRLMSLARGRDFMAFDRSIDVHISKLRAKLDAHPRFRNVIKTIWGTGYMFVDES